MKSTTRGILKIIFLISSLTFIMSAIANSEFYIWLSNGLISLISSSILLISKS